MEALDSSPWTGGVFTLERVMPWCAFIFWPSHAWDEISLGFSGSFKRSPSNAKIKSAGKNRLDDSRSKGAKIKPCGRVSIAALLSILVYFSEMIRYRTSLSGRRQKAIGRSFCNA
jgi:hypothetical protein